MIEKQDRDKGVGRYCSTNKPLTRFIKEGANRGLAPVHAALNMCIGWNVSVLNLDEDGGNVSAIPKSGGRFLLARRDCPHQTGLNNLLYDKQESTGSFVVVTWKKRSPLWVCPRSHFDLHRGADMKRKLTSLLKMEQVETPEESVFIGHGYIQHAGYGWSGIHFLRYHTDIVLKGVPLKDTVAFVYSAI